MAYGMKTAKIKKEKIYELTTNSKDGYAKWYVRGVKDDEEAKKVAKQGFGKRFYSPTLISYYDDYPSKYGDDWSKTPDKKKFVKLANKDYGQANKVLGYKD